MDKFDQMVEAIEETEDMVECKECFDLFPKADCTKMDHGYICPTCGQGAAHDISDVSFTDITTDLYSQEFPDVMDYDTEFKAQVDEKRPDYDIDTMVDILIKDEFDAIDSYEVADEVIQHAAGDEEIKDDLLDAIEHIKEEEEEHIEELNAAAGRVEAEEDESEKDDDEKASDDDEDDSEKDSEDEDDKEDDKGEDEKKDEEIDEALDSEPKPEGTELDEVLDSAASEELEEKKSDASMFKKLFKPVKESLTWICVYDGNEIGTVEADTEEEAADKMQQEYPEYHYGAYDGCFEVYLDEACKDHKAINHTEDEKEVLNEDSLVEWPMTKGKARNEVEQVFDKGFLVYNPKDPQTQRRTDNLADALATCKAMSKKYPKDKVYIAPLAIDTDKLAGYDSAVQKLINQPEGKKLAGAIVIMLGGKETHNTIKQFAKFKKNIDKQDKVINKRSSSPTEEDPSDVEVLEPKTKSPKVRIDAEEVETEETETEVEVSKEEKVVPKSDPVPEPELEADSEVTAESDPVETPVEKKPSKREIKRTKLQAQREKNKQIKGAIGKALAASGVSEADVSKIIKGIKDDAMMQLRKDLLGESLTEEFEEEATVECVWCNHTLPKSECRKEVDMGWLCDRCERAINSRGETLTFEQ